MLSTLLELVGYAALIAAALLWQGVPLALVVLGGVLLLIANGIELPDRRTTARREPRR